LVLLASVLWVLLMALTLKRIPVGIVAGRGQGRPVRQAPGLKGEDANR